MSGQQFTVSVRESDCQPLRPTDRPVELFSLGQLDRQTERQADRQTTATIRSLHQVARLAVESGAKEQSKDSDRIRGRDPNPAAGDRLTVEWVNRTSRLVTLYFLLEFFSFIVPMEHDIWLTQEAQAIQTHS